MEIIKEYIFKEILLLLISLLVIEIFITILFIKYSNPIYLKIKFKECISIRRHRNKFTIIREIHISGQNKDTKRNSKYKKRIQRSNKHTSNIQNSESTNTTKTRYIFISIFI